MREQTLLTDKIVMLCVECKSKRAYYNLAGEPAAYCCDCRKINMINTLSKKCDTCGLKIPSYNFSGLKAKFCKDCKSDEMINVANVSMMCSECGVKRASFSKNKSNSKRRPELCSTCAKSKLTNYLNVIIKKCTICRQKPAKYTNVSNEVNTDSAECDKYVKKNSALYCETCRPVNCVNVRKNLCVLCKNTTASYNSDDKTARYCAGCKSADMLSVKNKHARCHNCLKTRMNSKYKPHCHRCHVEKN